MSFVSRRARVWAGAALLLLACPAQAAVKGKVRLNLASKPVRAALLDLALQADLSLGGDLDPCRGRAPAILGRLRVEDALDLILSGSGCGWQRLEDAAFLISPTRPQPARPLSKPVPLVSPPVALGEVIITAQRQPNLPGRTPFAVSVVSSDQARRAGLGGLGDLEGEVAGLSTTHLGPGRDKVMLRGLSDGAFSGQTQSIVALYLDETPITYNAPDPNLRLADVERVEVLRGPQGTLYGGGSIGGVVRIVTRKPDLDTASLDLTASVSAAGGGGFGKAWEATVNLPLASGRLALRAVGYGETRDGYIRNPALGLRGANASARKGGRLSLRGQVSRDWALTLALTGQSIATDDTQYGFRRLGPLVRDNLVREPHENRFSQASLTVSGQGSWGAVSASAARLRHRFESRYDASGVASRFGLPSGPAAFDEAKKTDLTVAEITYSTPSGATLSGLAGAFVSAGRTRTRSALSGLAGPQAYGEDRDDDIREAALYGEGTLKVSASLFLTAGVRWFDYGLDARSRVTQGPGKRRFDGVGNESGFSPKLLVGWTPIADVLVYAEVAEGYRAGGFNTGGRLDQAFDQDGVPARRYRPDTLWNYELGVKARGWDGRLQTRLAIFEADWRSIQSDQHLGDGLSYTANIGSGHNLGLELETSWRVSPRLDLRAAALVSNPSLERRDPALDARGVALAGINGALASLAFDYHRDLPGGHRLRALGRLRYVGHGRLDLSPDPAARTPDYIEGAAALTWEAGRWSLGVHVDNLFGRRADSFGSGNPFHDPKDAVVTPLAPRTVTLRASSRF
ncbi:outer membrane receptor protein involved in Fe transport [Caulobacter rhizosphaerae]|uniref:Outer membrane receptor protein involved in Fe transport n=1 Tax=Caulobacter rhizosphaerae TaxID=2010972 RepID=A0ABU1MVI6_9CAUL|nr:TonB-dependent receptor [Caulobacter rhizosphaerae]MDR6530204.1 outer membrane receptor protein involved in Fe transport [Caulobacter rhizosphaerae]